MNEKFDFEISGEDLEEIFALEEKLVSTCGCAQCGGSDKC